MSTFLFTTLQSNELGVVLATGDQSFTPAAPSFWP